MLSRNPIGLDPTTASAAGEFDAAEGEVFTVQVFAKRNVTIVGNDTDCSVSLRAGGHPMCPSSSSQPLSGR
jgi:hypothetical protein